MPSIEKQCVFCGESCVGFPRIKNEKGEYAHRACAEARQKVKKQKGRPKQRPAQPQPAVTESEYAALGFDDNFDDMGDFLDDLPAGNETGGSPGMNAACSSCGVAMAPGSVVCMGCGFNNKSGKALQTVAKAQKTGPGAGATAAKFAGKAGAGAISPFLPIVGGCIAGAIGAAVWAAIAYFVHVEIGWVAIGVGALVGLGALIGARGDGNMWVGCVAAVIAVLSILAGKYAVVSIQFDEAFGEISSGESIRVDESWMLQDIVDAIAYERIGSGIPIDWPQRGMSIEEAEWPHDYPADLQAQARAEWDAIPAEDQQSQIADYQREMDDVDFGDFESEIKKEGFKSSFGMFDLVFLFFAVMAAYGIGAQED